MQCGIGGIIRGCSARRALATLSPLWLFDGTLTDWALRITMRASQREGLHVCIETRILTLPLTRSHSSRHVECSAWPHGSTRSSSGSHAAASAEVRAGGSSYSAERHGVTGVRGLSRPRFERGGEHTPQRQMQHAACDSGSRTGSTPAGNGGYAARIELRSVAATRLAPDRRRHKRQN